MEYRQNLVNIINLAGQKNIALLFVTVPSHIGHPYLFKVPAKNPRVTSLLDQFEKRLLKKQYESALEELEEAKNLSPEYYRTYFLRGMVLQLMKRDGSHEEYEKSLELHPFPERLKKSYNQILLKTAIEYKIPVVDLYQRFRDHPSGLDRLFIDACHPSYLGDKLIADLLAVPVLVSRQPCNVVRYMV